MGYGLKFQQYVEELRNIGFPVDKVSGGEIHRVFERGLDIKSAILELHRAAENRRKRMQVLNRTVG